MDNGDAGSRIGADDDALDGPNEDGSQQNLEDGEERKASDHGDEENGNGSRQ